MMLIKWRSQYIVKYDKKKRRYNVSLWMIPALISKKEVLHNLAQELVYIYSIMMAASVSERVLYARRIFSISLMNWIDGFREIYKK